MHSEILIAGFGGQGIVFLGQVLANAALDKGKAVLCLPSYGPEMRGGTANCTIMMSDEEIIAPMVKHPPAIVAMNLPSLDKYEAVVKPGGVLVVNASLVDRQPYRSDLLSLYVPCNEIADELGEPRLANMVAAGALLALYPVLELQDVEETLRAHMPGRHRHLLIKNAEALQRGSAHVLETPVHPMMLGSG